MTLKKGVKKIIIFIWVSKNCESAFVQKLNFYS